MTIGAMQSMQTSLKNNQRPKRKAFKKWKNIILNPKKRESPLNYGKKSEVKLKKLKDKIAREKRTSLIKQLIILIFVICVVAIGFYFFFSVN